MTSSISRIAVTAPPKAWFHGITRAHYEIYRQALADLGLTLFDVPVEAFQPQPDAGRISDLIHDLRAFGPQLAIGLPYLSHALVCRLAPDRDGWQPNLFTDILDIPTLGPWDHAPLELADQILTPHPASPTQSQPGALRRLQRTLAHPRLLHWCRDSGQIAIMRGLGLLGDAPPIQHSRPMLPATRHAPASDGNGPHVAFIGHFYQGLPAYADPALAAIATDSVARWLATGGAMWQALLDRVTEAPTEVRRRLALDLDQTFFWGFAHRLVIHEAQTARRFDVLGAAGEPVACYGNLRTGVAGVPGNLVAVPGHIPFGEPLSEVLARHPITVDVMSPGFINTVSQKVLHGFNAGGFMLVDRKSDFVAEFGELAEAVSYADGADLAAKVDLYLSRPRLRREVGDAMRERLAERHALPDVLRRVLDQVTVRASAPGSSSSGEPAGAVDVLGQLTRARQAMPFGLSRPILGPLPTLNASSRGVELITQTRAWKYAAALALPRPKASTQAPCLWVTLQVTSGRLGVGVLSNNREPVTGEQLIGPSRQPVTIGIGLPRDRPATVVFRSVIDESSRAVISQLRYDQGIPGTAAGPTTP